ncbi:hypothetical protein WICMUC_005598 [Wickerhamomyces mucosus]|uniref:Sulfhydryl oxidase n=1 Tax=Wickerhamomyces mucosus TaxID=1378264 RepID=A0A9P8P8G8_9ASCO|nr:hypothetical protein WICMUC_005598 [Wickerhamomyces mucosus]
MRALKKPLVNIIGSCIIVLTLYLLIHQTSQLQDPKPLDPNKLNTGLDTKIHKSNEKQLPSDVDLIKDDFNIDSTKLNNAETPFMPQMTNETLKAELGRSSWRLFHTILARYPETPTEYEKSTLKQYIYLFAQVYPCGDCARHFQKLLDKYPPQTINRQVASLWGCDIHNKVNDRLGKEIYDCSTILEDYDCGCGVDEELDQYDETKHSVGTQGTKIDKDHLKFELNSEDKQLG